jgi:hypothetical protein
MTSIRLAVLAFAAAFVASGCTAETKTTDDSTKIQIDVPKLERGSAPIDLDPRTDKDIDVDTPIKGDK